MTGTTTGGLGRRPAQVTGLRGVEHSQHTPRGVAAEESEEEWEEEWEEELEVVALEEMDVKEESLEHLQENL